MAINLDKQIGPFPLKIWLVVAAGGIGAGLLLAKHQSAKNGAINGVSDGDASDRIAVPPGVTFAHINIFSDASIPEAPNTAVPEIKPPTIALTPPMQVSAPIRTYTPVLYGASNIASTPTERASTHFNLTTTPGRYQ